MCPGNVYCTKTHDSLRISNGKWCWFSRGDWRLQRAGLPHQSQGLFFYGGHGNHLRKGGHPAAFLCASAEGGKDQAPASAPGRPRQPGDDGLSQRPGAIDQEILDYCVQTGRIYESRNKGHSNVVFVGFDKDGKARFGCLRGISEARFHGDLSGSDKHFSFALPACVENPAVHLWRGAPLMSCPTPRSASWTGSTGGGTTCCPWPGCVSAKEKDRGKQATGGPHPVFGGSPPCENGLSPFGQRHRWPAGGQGDHGCHARGLPGGE